MGRSASTGDDHFDPPRFGCRRVLEEQIRRAVSGDHFRLVRDTEGLEDLRSVLHGVPIRLGAHYQSNERIRHSNSSWSL
jgi:hypothetical protein